MLPVLTSLVLGAGAALAIAGDRETAHRALFIGLLVVGLPLIARTARGALRGHFAADIVLHVLAPLAAATGSA